MSKKVKNIITTSLATLINCFAASKFAPLLLKNKIYSVPMPPMTHPLSFQDLLFFRGFLWQKAEENQRKKRKKKRLPVQQEDKLAEK